MVAPNSWKWHRIPGKVTKPPKKGLPDGSRQIGPRQIGPRQIGPLADLAANWAPHFLGPNLPFFGKSGPGRLGPLAADWAPANWAPADWAPCRQIGPLGGKLGPLAANWAPANRAPANWATVLYSFVLDIFCQQLGKYMSVEFLYIGIGYILPTIGGYMSFGGCQCSLREQGWGICIL